MRNFLLTEKEAYDIVKYVDALDLGDELHDTLMYLVDDGDLEETLEGLENLIHELSNARMNLMAAFTGVKKRLQD